MSILEGLMVDSKSAWVSYPEFDGFEVEVATLARQELIALRKSCMFQKFDRKTHNKVDELDEDKFIRKFTEATVKNWKGLKYKYLESMIPVDISKVDAEEEMPYALDDAILLVKNSGDFDTWLNEVVFDLDNFRTEREEKLWQRLDLWQRNIEQKVTKETYLKICDELEQEPDPARIPPDLADFPLDVQKAIVVYGKLGDRIVYEIGYLGKDFTTLEMYMSLYDVEFKDLFIETILLLDRKMIEKSAQAMKRERDKLKKKN